MIAFLIYLMSILDDVNASCGFIAIFSGIAAIIVILFHLLTEGDVGPIKWIKYSIITCFTSLIISTLVPESKTLAAMYLVPKIIENKQVSELPEKMLKLLNVKLDDWISDLAEEKEKK